MVIVVNDEILILPSFKIFNSIVKSLRVFQKTALQLL